MNTNSIKGNPQQGLVGATLGFFIGFAAVALFGTTANKFSDAMHLTPVLVGLLVAIPNLTGSLLRIPFAAWVDISGGRRPFLTLLFISIVGMAGLTWFVSALYPGHLNSSMYWIVLLLGGLSGCGIATFSVGISQVSYWFPKSRQGAALGTYAGVGNLAPGIFTFILPFVLVVTGLSGAYLLWLLVLVAGTVLYYLLGRNSPYFQLRSQGLPVEQARALARNSGQEMFPAGSLVDSLKISGKIWKTWVLVAIYFTTFGGFLAMTSWLPTYWKTFFAVPAITAGVLTASYSVLTSLLRVAGGRFADRLGGEKTLLMALGAMTVGAVFMLLSHSVALSIAAELVMGVGMGVGNAAVFKLVPQEVPQAVGGASGWVGGLGAFGGFVIPPVLGEIVHRVGLSGYASGFILFLGLALMSLGLAYVLRQNHPIAESAPAQVEQLSKVSKG